MITAMLQFADMQSLKLFLLQQWTAVCSTTGIKVLSFIQAADTVFERSMWFLALVFAAVMTCIDLNDTIRKYQSDQTLTSVTFLSNSSITFTNPAYCIHENFSHFAHFSLTNAKISNTTSVVAFLQTFENINISSYFEEQNQLMSVATNLDSVLTTKSSIFFDLFALVGLTMSKMIRTELSFDKWHLQNNSNSSDIAAIVYKVLRRNGRWESTLEHFSDAYWCLLQLSVYYTATKSTVNLCGSRLTSWYGIRPGTHSGIEYVCAQLSPTAGFIFPANQHYYKITHILPDFVASARNSLVVVDNLFTVKIDSHGHPSTEDSTKIDFEQGNTYQLYIKLLGHYKMRKTASCSQKLPKFICEISCRTAAIFQLCNCRPMMSAYTVVGKEFGNTTWCANQMEMGRYPCEQFNGTKLGQIEDLCKDECLPLCERKIHGFMTIKQSVAKSNTTETVVICDSLVFPMFEENSLLEFKQFLSLLGGNLSFWLGASFLVVLHLLVSAAKLPVAYFKHITEQPLRTETKENCPLTPNQLITLLNDPQVVQMLKKTLKQSDTQH